MLDREVDAHCSTCPETCVGAYWWAALSSAWVFLSASDVDALGWALTVTSSSCDGADDVRLGGAFLGPDHEFRSVPFIAYRTG